MKNPFKNLPLTHYRTSVLNDFSAVSKAFFQVYKLKGMNMSIVKNKAFEIFNKAIEDSKNSKNSENRSPISFESAESLANKSALPYEFEFVKQFPVQINPNSLRIDYSADSKKRMEQPIDTSKNLGIPMISTRHETNPDSVSIDLDYNIYDEYNARTMDGSIPNNSISLHSNGKKITSLEELRRYAGNTNGYYVMFIWGEINIFGFLSSLGIVYNSFSRWGEPLSATVNANINRQPLGYDADGIELDPMSCSANLGTGISKAETYRKVRDHATRAELLATNALR